MSRLKAFLCARRIRASRVRASRKHRQDRLKERDLNGSEWSGRTIRIVRDLYEQLASAPSLEPSEKTDALFSRLVEQCTQADAGTAADVLSDPEVVRLRPRLIELCSAGEYLLERSWARAAVQAKNPRAELARFPYHANYERLTQLEVHALLGAAERAGDHERSRVRRVLFVGSGPLPLTSILLAEVYGMKVDNVDSDPEAHRLGAKLARAAGLAVELSFRLCDAAEVEDLGSYDVVFLAALAGLDEAEKRSIIEQLRQRMQPEALLVIRTAHQMKSLLYPRVEPEDLDGFEPQIVVQPLNEVINSVIVARKPAEAGDVGRVEVR